MASLNWAILKLVAFNLVLRDSLLAVDNCKWTAFQVHGVRIDGWSSHVCPSTLDYHPHTAMEAMGAGETDLVQCSLSIDPCGLWLSLDKYYITYYITLITYAYYTFRVPLLCSIVKLLKSPGKYLRSCPQSNMRWHWLY